jgi:hypothetical protein
VTATEKHDTTPIPSPKGSQPTYDRAYKHN